MIDKNGEKIAIPENPETPEITFSGNQEEIPENPETPALPMGSGESGREIPGGFCESGKTKHQRREISRFVDPSDGIELVLFDRGCGTGGWVNYKIETACGRAPKKNNWWIAHDTTENQITQGRDTKILAEHRPEAFDWFMGVIS